MYNLLKTTISTAISACLLQGCSSHTAHIEPQLDYGIQDKYIQQLDPLFTTLQPEEKQTPWGTEYAIGLQFAKQLDLYQAVTAFKRAQILIPDDNLMRSNEIQYYILKCYYLGKRYDEVIDYFETSSFANFPPCFSGHHDLLVMLFDAYIQSKQPDEALHVIDYMQKLDPIRSQELHTTDAILRGDLVKLSSLEQSPDVQEATEDLLASYYTLRKSSSTAALYNALLPGAGYWYLGQKHAACTAFCFNTLFIAAATYFFQEGNIPAGIITLGFETGWYMGGIYGVQQSAKLYNERLFEQKAHHHLKEQKLFPILMLQYGF